MSGIDDIEGRLPPLDDLAQDLANIERAIYGETWEAMQKARKKLSTPPIHDALPDDTSE